MSEDKKFRVVNIVGTGVLGKEISLDALAEDLPFETWENPGSHPGLHLRLEEDGPLTTFYNSGKFIIRVPHGSVEDLEDQYDSVINELEKIGAIDGEDEVEFMGVDNIVSLGHVGKRLNLQALPIALGLEKVEYEPEQFPALIYKSEDYPCTFLAFANGKVIVSGATDSDEAEEAFNQFVDEIDEWTDLPT